MKKILAILIAVVFISSVAFAQQAAAPVKAAKEIAVKTKQVMGKIVQVTVADPAKGIATSTVTVVDDLGKTATFTVASTTKILDKGLKTATLSNLKKDEKVKVKYSQTKEGKPQAESIHVTK